MRSEVSKMNKKISMRSEIESIQEFELISSGETLLDLSGTELIPVSQICLLCVEKL